MCFVLGAYGNEWAWRNKRWESVEHFHRVQATWAGWGAVITLVVSTGLFLFFLGVASQTG